MKPIASIGRNQALGPHPESVRKNLPRASQGPKRWNIRLRSEAVVNRNALQASYLEMSFYLATPSSILSHALRRPRSLRGRLEGWQRVPRLHPSFETAAQEGRPPQDEAFISSCALWR